jgi:peptidoglycan hydrolase CwlO-like protein
LSSGRNYARYVTAIVVIVIVALGGVFAYLTTTSLQSQASSLKSNQTSLESGLSSLENELSSASAPEISLSSSISSLLGQVSSLQNQLSNANSSEFQQQSQISSLQSQLSTDSFQYTSLQSQISSIQGQVANLTSIAGVQLAAEWWDQVSIGIAANSCNKTAFTDVPYAGYVEVDFLSSTPVPLNASLSWSAYGVSYSPTIVPSTPGIALFIVLPTSSATFSLCDSSASTPVTLVVTLVYHY